MTDDVATYDELLAEVRAALDTNEDPVWPHPLADYDLTLLMAFIFAAREHQRYHRELEKHLRAELADRLGGGGSVTDGYWLYRYHHPGKRVIVAPEQVVEHLGVDALKLFRADSARITVFRDLLSKRGLDADTIAEIERTVFTWEHADEPVVEITPLDRAPKWAQQLTPGRITRRH